MFRHVANATSHRHRCDDGGELSRVPLALAISLLLALQAELRLGCWYFFSIRFVFDCNCGLQDADFIPQNYHCFYLQKYSFAVAVCGPFQTLVGHNVCFDMQLMESRHPSDAIYALWCLILCFCGGFFFVICALFLPTPTNKDSCDVILKLVKAEISPFNIQTDDSLINEKYSVSSKYIIQHRRFSAGRNRSNTQQKEVTSIQTRMHLSGNIVLN